MLANYTMYLYPTIFTIVSVSVGLATAIGYYRTQAQKVWRESAEGWKTENEANKERADRLAGELVHTASELKEANMRTDITQVLEVLAVQHKEATNILLRIANEAMKREDKNTMLLQRIADESADRNGHIANVIVKGNEAQAESLSRIAEVAAETLRLTVEAEVVQ